MTTDAKLVLYLNGLTGHFPIFDAAIIFFSSYLPYLLAAFFLLLLYYSSYSRWEKLHIFWVTAISAGVARFGVTELVYLLYHRPRPFVAYQLHPLFIDTGWSFPSGHAALCFSMASAVFLYNKKWGIGFFISALVVTVSRVTAGVHYPTDILGGLIIGMVVAFAVFHIAEWTGRPRFAMTDRQMQGQAAPANRMGRKVIAGLLLALVLPLLTGAGSGHFLDDRKGAQDESRPDLLICEAIRPLAFLRWKIAQSSVVTYLWSYIARNIVRCAKLQKGVCFEHFERPA